MPENEKSHLKLLDTTIVGGVISPEIFERMRLGVCPKMKPDVLFFSKDEEINECFNKMLAKMRSFKEEF